MPILQTDKIRKEFGELVAVNDVNLSIDKGQVVGLIGPNGAGKTTLLRILATVLEPTSGNATLLGADLLRDYLQIRKCIGFLPDFFNLYSDLTLRECLEFFAKAYEVEPEQIPKQVDTALDYVDLQFKRDDFIRNLSRGMVQRLGVAALLVHSPELFLLDEPASGLDPKARVQLREILQRLSNEGKTIIISSHILTELSGFCTHIAVMNEGHMLMYGDVDEIQRKILRSKKVIISVLEDCDKAVAIIEDDSDTKINTVQHNTITVETRAGDIKLASLNTRLVQGGIKVTAFYEETTNLEDLFMKISSGEKI